MGNPTVDETNTSKTTESLLTNEDPKLAELFPEELIGWHGYVEWEKYPERCQKAHEILTTYKSKFTHIPEFQFEPLPATNPILIGHRWKEYHAVLGPYLKDIPAESWAIVQQEKAADMIHVLDFPYNGEPPRNKLMQNKMTPNEYHFVRNHGGIPTIDKTAFTLTIGGLVNKPQILTLADLQDPKKFEPVEVTVTLQCSGTRRIEQIHEYPGEGDELINAPWGEGAIGTARYRGVSLKKVLKYCGGMQDEAQHIEFIGADTYFKKLNVFNYAVSVPRRKVEALNEVLLVWEMNGEPLPAIHGAPLRVVVTGFIGARSCKWVLRVNVLNEPSRGPVQQQEYLYYGPQIGKQNVLFSNGFSIQEMPVGSAIMTPNDKQVVVHQGKIEMTGWAYSGGSRWIERVDVSADGGHTWLQCDPDDMTEKHYHAWRLWKITLPVLAEGWLELVVRAFDNACNTQPTYVRSVWNWDLHVTSSAHRIKIYSVNASNPATAKRLRQIEENGDSLEPITRPLMFRIESEEHYEKNVKKHKREPED
ncbi:unnamed protein product [Adineta steineri]|uniref:Sulfite oxidase n=1 Tax=Adineta steineri TaxID=433720 RepID=A0A814IQ33_9BILA|nr:unnamed protein product [Adineta steineri]CAF3954481.1 unnamed protein product [Adineta steineri]